MAKAKRKSAAGGGAGSPWDLSARVRSQDLILKATGSYEGAAASNPHFRKNFLAAYESRVKDPKRGVSSLTYNPGGT